MFIKRISATFLACLMLFTGITAFAASSSSSNMTKKEIENSKLSQLFSSWENDKKDGYGGRYITKNSICVMLVDNDASIKKEIKETAPSVKVKYQKAKYSYAELRAAYNDISKQQSTIGLLRVALNVKKNTVDVYVQEKFLDDWKKLCQDSHGNIVSVKASTREEVMELIKKEKEQEQKAKERFYNSLKKDNKAALIVLIALVSIGIVVAAVSLFVVKRKSNPRFSKHSR